MRVLIADDHAIVRLGFRQLLESIPEIRAVEEVSNGQQILDFLKFRRVECLFLDLNMPVMNGFEVLDEVQKLGKAKPKIIIFSLLTEKYPVLKAYQKGIDGYISKNTGKKELMDLLQKLKDGEQYYSKDVYRVLLSEIRKKQESDSTELNGQILSEIEQKVVKALCKQRNNQEIADQLFLSPNTIKRHRQRIKEKIGAKNVVGFISYALKNGIIEVEELSG